MRECVESNHGEGTETDHFKTCPRLGLRHIDTAEAYQNEAEIGLVGPYV